MFDVVVVGGSYAGMAAALQLARGRRQVLVLDAGLPRNRFASRSHGVLGHDGKTPAEIAGSARAQLCAYANVTWVDGKAATAARAGDAFVVQTEQGERFEARRLILAIGVRDELPAIPGLAERWGQSVFHCPYCHGYELDNGPLGVLAVGEVSMHQALLIPDWGKTTFFTNGVFEPDEEQRRTLAARQVTLETARVLSISGQRATVNLADGRSIDLAGLFIAARAEPSSPLAAQLGCAFSESPLGSVVQTDGTKETSVPGVFACGDVARAAGNITFAMADGALAGAAAHRSLIFSALA